MGKLFPTGRFFFTLCKRNGEKCVIASILFCV